MLLDKFFPPDIRVEKEARTLLGAGHELFLFCPGRNGAPNDEQVEGIRVIRKKLPQVFSKRVWIYFGLQVFSVHPFWKNALEATVEKYKIEAIHIHDLPLVRTGLYVARSFRIPLIADLHENYPEAIKTWATTWKTRLIQPIITKRWQQIEKHSVRQADRVITVVDEAREHYVRDCQISPEKTTVVMNTEDLDYFCSLPIETAIVEKYEPYFTISYIGGFGQDRGLEISISAMPRILQDVPHARLVLVGSGANEAQLRKMASKQKVAKEVEFTGQQPFNLVPSYIVASKICLIPHIASEHTNTTIPHKIFQCMAMRRPVVVSSAKPLERIVKEAGAGLVYPSADPAALAEAVITMYRDGTLAARLGEAGRKAVEEKYNWEIEGDKLLAVYRDLC